MISLVSVAVLAVSLLAQPDVTPLADFTSDAHGWRGNAQVEELRATPEGLAFRATGRDPWIESRTLEAMPGGVRMELRLRMRSTAAGHGEVFTGPDFRQQDAVRFPVNHDGAWHEYAVLLPAQEADTRLRIDPSTAPGEIAIASIAVRPFSPAATTELESAVPFDLPDDRIEVSSGAVTIALHPQRFNAFTITIDGVEMARSHAAARIGYLLDGEAHTLNLSDAAVTASEAADGAVTIAAEREDAGGAVWSWSLVFTPSGDGAIDIESRVTVSEPRAAFHLPMLTLLPGFQSFGARKTQALLPGVEYLEDEPSSSEADLRGEQAIRRMVADFRIAYPFMALVHEGRYLGLAWDRVEKPQAVFDSPDTMLDSSAHLFGLWLPAVGEARLENALEVLRAIESEDGAFPVVHATILGGQGDSVVPAMQHFVQRRDLPPLPEFEGGFDHAVRLLAHGWLDSDLHEDGLWRHAVWGEHFGPSPASDAVAYMRWLARHTDDTDLQQRLEAVALRGIERLPEGNPAGSGVSHVRRPLPPLVMDGFDAYLESHLNSARAMLGAFEEDGVLRYKAREGGTDYGSTHFADHANGLAAVSLSEILETAALTGDPALTDAAIALLDQQTALYAHSVPRGAQTWEIPLHTPDILASGRLVQSYVLGYLLTGREDLLEEARYWAWTGLAFIYLDNPTDGPVGLYATTPVLGATNWVAPNWIGLPVQWCGLVYRSALEELALVDAEHAALWQQVAHGITISGLQQSFPLTDEERQGLLPDFFYLEAQLSDGPAINPGTVQFHLPEVYGKTPFFQRRRAAATGAIVSAPGGIRIEEDQPGRIAIALEPWTDGPYRVVISHLPGEWRVTGWTGADKAPGVNTHRWEGGTPTSRLAIELTGSGSGTLTLEPTP